MAPQTQYEQVMKDGVQEALSRYQTAKRIEDLAGRLLRYAENAALSHDHAYVYTMDHPQEVGSISHWTQCAEQYDKDYDTALRDLTTALASLH